VYEIHSRYLHLTGSCKGRTVGLLVGQSVSWAEHSVSNTGLSVFGARWLVAGAGQLVLRAGQSVFSAEKSVSGAG